MKWRRPRALWWQVGAGIIGLQAVVLVVLGWYAHIKLNATVVIKLEIGVEGNFPQVAVRVGEVS